MPINDAMNIELATDDTRRVYGLGGPDPTAAVAQLAQMASRVPAARASMGRSPARRRRAHACGHVLLDPLVGQPGRGESVAHGCRGGLVVGHTAIVH